jgi:ferritin-like metal-binding protein YciE
MLEAFRHPGSRRSSLCTRKPGVWCLTVRGEQGSKRAGSTSNLPSTRDLSVKMELSTLKDLYIHELKDLYSAEKQIVKALPKMAKAATNAALASGLKQHLEETKEQAIRLEKILSSHGQSTRGPKCKGMEGVLAEGAEISEEEADDEVRDAGLISAAQRVEHYEMAGYGSAKSYAELLDDDEGAKLLQMTLDEEKATDEKLTVLATSSINLAAVK